MYDPIVLGGRCPTHSSVGMISTAKIQGKSLVKTEKHYVYHNIL